MIRFDASWRFNGRKPRNMPTKAPRICGCGNIIPVNEQCACQAQANKERRKRNDASRPTAAQRGYDHEWQKYRAEFLRKNPKCARCGAKATVVDHIVPHKGNKHLFWLEANHAALCAKCHNSYKQRMERKQ